MATQLITPDPNIACVAGLCLQYVRQTFGLPARYVSATQAWENSPSQHRDENFPAGCWVPVWFAIDIEPNGHVALLAPDGSVYSSSDNGSVPHHHPGIAELISYYAYWGKMQLTYLGWSEDVAGYPVVSADTITFESTTPAQEEDPMAPFNKDDLIAAAQQGAMNALNFQVSDGEVMLSLFDVARILRPLVHAVPNEIMTRDVVKGGKDSGGGTSSLAGIIAYFDQSRIDTINAFKAAPVAGSPGPAVVDIDALVARLKAELPPAVFAQFKDQINK